MNGSVTEARRTLQAVLQRENAALRRTDFPAAAALLPEKIRALQQWQSAQPSLSSSPSVLGRVLQAVIEDNTKLLEQAVVVQTRVVELIARAARRGDEGGARYGAQGREARDGGALALLTRA